MGRYDDEVDDDRPSRNTRSSRRDDDDEDERPVRRSRSRDDDEDERPARRSSSRRDDDDDDDRPARDDGRTRSHRSHDDDDDKEDRPSGRRSRDDDDDDKPKRNAPKNLKGGWGEADKARSETSPYADRFQLDTSVQLVKFLEDKPYVVFKQHWIPREGQKSFLCIANEEPKGCPLCNAGDTPSSRVCFNIALVNLDGEEPQIKSLECSGTTAEQIKNYHNEKATGPITKGYWTIKKASAKKNASAVLNPVKERDLEDDYPGAQPLDDRDIRDLMKRAYTPSIVNLPTYKQLREIAAEDLGAD